MEMSLSGLVLLFCLGKSAEGHVTPEFCWYFTVNKSQMYENNYAFQNGNFESPWKSKE